MLVSERGEDAPFLGDWPGRPPAGPGADLWAPTASKPRPHTSSKGVPIRAGRRKQRPRSVTGAQSSTQSARGSPAAQFPISRMSTGSDLALTPGKAQRDSRRHPATSPRTRNVAHGFGAPVGGWACCPTGTRWSQQERRHQILPGSLWAEAACGQRGPRALEPGSPQQGPAWRRSALRGVPSPAVPRLPCPTAVLTRPPADPAPLQEGQGRCRCRLVPSALIAQPAWLASPLLRPRRYQP